MKTWLEQVADIEREDILMFINSCFTCTGQKEFYSDAEGQKVSLNFLHDYILGNYRLLYARTLAAGINHFNIGQIIIKLLATGKDTLPEHKEEEGQLIARALQNLPTQRAWKVLAQLQTLRINNRRSRAIVRDYLQQRKELSFDAVKYRLKLKSIAVHNHLSLEGELGTFLFTPQQPKRYQNELFENFRQAHFTAEAIYKLPFTIAEGLAAKKGIPRAEFLTRIEPQMTRGEKLRYLQTAERVSTRTKQVKLDVDWQRLSLTRLALYILSLSIEDRKAEFALLQKALVTSAQRTCKKTGLKLGKVAAILDCSYSASGSVEKRRRPLGIALAAHYLLEKCASEYRSFWTIPVSEPLLVQARGQTDLATPLLDALEWKADLVIIISDGYENDPPEGAAEVLRIYRTKLDRSRQTSIIHCNPVFAPDTFSPYILSPYIPTLGIREAEDLPTLINFARFADGDVSLKELEDYLALRVQQMLTTSEFTVHYDAK
ncbi:MAG: hypothetical protein QNJ41_06540 [Xenococcaceae cyanobacterium MO_188.B32]|nr:hypothetical protein [Xenococcaceae cyanobacterium MO_188.B32]